MNCSQCGYELKDGAAFCEHCGTPAGQMAQTAPFGAQPQPGEGKAIASLVCGIVSWLTCGGLFLLPIIGLFLGLFGLKSRRQNMAITGICLNAAAFLLCLPMCGMMIALLLPAVQAAREAAVRMQCSNHEKQIVLALHNYHDTHGALPPLYTVDAEGRPLHSWRVLILPYINQENLYSQIRLDEPWNSEHNKRFHDAFIAVYNCPKNQSARGSTNNCTYAAIAGEAFVPAKEAGQITGIGFAHIADGTSNTIAVIEVREPFCWMDPAADVTLDELARGVNSGGRVGSSHVGGCNAGMCDSSCRFISNSIDLALLRAMGTRAGGESVYLD